MTCYSRSMHARSHCLSKQKHTGEYFTDRLNPCRNLSEMTSGYVRGCSCLFWLVWITASSSTSFTISQHTSCPNEMSATDAFSGNNVRNSARKSVSILIAVFYCNFCSCAWLCLAGVARNLRDIARILREVARQACGE